MRLELSEELHFRPKILEGDAVPNFFAVET